MLWCNIDFPILSRYQPLSERAELSNILDHVEPDHLPLVVHLAAVVLLAGAHRNGHHRRRVLLQSGKFAAL